MLPRIALPFILCIFLLHILSPASPLQCPATSRSRRNPSGLHSKPDSEGPRRTKWSAALTKIQLLDPARVPSPFYRPDVGGEGPSEDALRWDDKLERWRGMIEDYYKHKTRRPRSRRLSRLLSRLSGAMRRSHSDKMQQPYMMSNCGWVRDGHEAAMEEASALDGALLIPQPPSHVADGHLSPAAPTPLPGTPLPHTDLLSPSLDVTIVTSASLPWLTGTSVNPLLRAAYLLRARGGSGVNIMLPWLERREDQDKVYMRVFQGKEDQENFVRSWLAKEAGMPAEAEALSITWYPARHQPSENSVYSMGDITALCPPSSICILEEPEHLNWYRAPGAGWTSKFDHVVGIVHTNYFAYALDQPASIIRAPAMKYLCRWMMRAHCHRVVKLSGALGVFAEEKEVVRNVHGVRATFLDIGREMGARGKGGKVVGVDERYDSKVYFIGKMLFSKGIGTLVDLLDYSKSAAGLDVEVDMYGAGPDLDACSSLAGKKGIDLSWHGKIDHAELAKSHKVFVNPSTSEVLCTTIAEALAMGKFVICASHPSNDFFTQFPNCLPYSSKEEFVGNLCYALSHDPEPLKGENAAMLSWEAATERLTEAAMVTEEERDRWLEEDEVAVKMPSLVRNKVMRKEIHEGLINTRTRYRKFKSRLAAELDSPRNPLPPTLKSKLRAELERKLDVDFEKLLREPELRLQLSPAELDKKLLEIYDNVSRSPGGDILRIIGGGTDVGTQNFYTARKKLIGGDEKEEWRGSGAAKAVRNVLEEVAKENLIRQEEELTQELRRRWKKFNH